MTMGHTFDIRLSFSHPLRRGLLFAVVTLVIYSVVVIATSPSLAPSDSVRIAFTLNWWVILGVTVGAGTQGFLVSYAKERACNFRMKKPLTGTSGLMSAFSSFLSYFALIPIGCCGTWLYIISFLPGVLGTGASVFLIDYSRPIAIGGLVLMAVSILYTYLSIRKRLHGSSATPPG